MWFGIQRHSDVTEETINGGRGKGRDDALKGLIGNTVERPRPGMKVGRKNVILGVR